MSENKKVVNCRDCQSFSMGSKSIGYCEKLHAPVSPNVNSTCVEFKPKNSNQHRESKETPEAATANDKQKADRHNAGKPQLSFLLSAPNAINELSKVFEFGVEKYARDNWKKGLDRHQIVDSLLRHLTASENGEQVDTESGLDHKAHVLWNALVLLEQHGNHKQK